MSKTPSVFAAWQPKFWKYRFAWEAEVIGLQGGIPTNPAVIEGWLRTKTGISSDDLLRDAIAEVMVERGVSEDEATQQVARTRHLVGFKRNSKGIYYEGRQLKAAIKEAASSARANDLLPAALGSTKKGTLNYIAEHVSVVEDHIPVMVKGSQITEPDEVEQSFTHGRFGSSIKLAETIHVCTLAATIETDTDFTDDQWAAIWLAAERLGVGANRSQGHGRFTVTKWERLAEPRKRTTKKST
jgi:hypothetical protein